MDELSEDQLRELEEKLYSQVHHQSSTFSDLSAAPSCRKEEEEQSKTQNTKFLSSRYWAKNNEIDKAAQKPQEKLDKNEASKAPNKNKQPEEKSTVQKGAPHAKNKQHQKVRNPFANPQKQQQKNKANLGGPFARQAQQLQRAAQYESKKQKSKNSRAAMAKRPKVVETVVLDSSNESDESDPEVVVVPLPPNPVYSIDDSDDDDEAKESNVVPSIETDDKTKDSFITPKSKKSPPSSVLNEQAGETASRCNSPNSVMSQDDFIGQSDRQRLLKSGTVADDADLLILTNNTDSLLDAPTPPEIVQAEQDSSNDIECIGTFIKPTATAAHGGGKQSYRVDHSGFGAMDVYESESDIVSDGVYSKGVSKTQTPTTTIRNIDNSSGSEVDVTTTVPVKTKRLRKRRASVKGNESNGPDYSDSDEDDGVAATGVPFISRGPAVEGCKSKKFRRRTVSTNVAQTEGTRTDQMTDSTFMATLNSLAQGSNNEETARKSTDGDESEAENLPTARDIAETVISQQQSNTSTPVRRSEKQEAQENTASNDAIEAVPAHIADDIEKLFDKINELAAKKATAASDEDVCVLSVEAHVDPASDDSVAVVEETNSTTQSEDMDSKIKYFIAYTPSSSNCISDGFGWNEEMRRFYNYSWGGENAREEDILRRMNRDKRLWAINDSDRFLSKNKRDRREKCINCYSFGHIRARCPKPRKPLTCFMCGESGHQESRCPNTRCLRCGSKTTVYSQSCKKCIYWNNRICPICKLRGHSLNDCPDKWRRYHSTTKPNVFPDSRVIYNKRRYCCFCGRRGHLSDDCKKAIYRSEYPLISSEIKSHEKSYDDVFVKCPHTQNIPCRLLYDPNVKVNFDLAANTTRKLVYGRFLCAVGLENLIGVKNNENKANSAVSTPKVSNVSAEQEEPSCSKPANTSPEQVPEVSESTHESSIENSETLQMPPPPTPSQTTQETINEPMDHDSDSNYSFSDHFEPPTTSVHCTEKIAPLPDFIPFTSSTTPTQEKEGQIRVKSMKDLVPLSKNKPPKMGISARYVERHSGDEDEDVAETAETPKDDVSADIPCEAKIYVSNEHSSYFQSKLGQEYLNKIMSENNLRGRLNKTIVGYALFIHGLPSNQVKLQRELELKFKSLSDTKTQQYEISSKVPRQVSVLRRFLRDSINQLYGNLGNASELCKRLSDLDKYTSKNSIKSAERIRRTLNMIFIGQAGLVDGDKHIETLLTGLQTLFNDLQSTEKTPEELRNKIDASWRKIFTPYHHKNYSQLLISYLKIPPVSRNRLPQLKIDPVLLGKTQFNVVVSDKQETRTAEHSKQIDNTVSNMKAVEEGTLLLNVFASEQSNLNESMKNTESQSSHEKKQQKQPESSTTVEKKTANSDMFNDKECLELLSEIAASPESRGKVCDAALKDSKMPSMFWSRESQRYLKELIKLAADKPPTIERLQRIYRKAIAGGLSYNDYRSVVELYNVTNKISKK